MMSYAAPPPPKPAQQIVVQQSAAQAQPAVNPKGSGGQRTFANRHERRHYESDLRRAARKRWRGAVSPAHAAPAGAGKDRKTARGRGYLASMSR